MGVVHLARKPGGERVALKVLRPHIVGDDEARQRLAREVSSLTRVKSRRVAEIVDADPWGDIPFVATRYVPGLSLHDHVHQEGRIEGADLLWFASCLAEALAAVHGVGVLHRDIKPSNILMEGRTPILIDFGLARVADDPKLTHTGWLLGTPGYLAPEILFGKDATAASDIHSWGATVAFAGTGRAPFGRGPSVAIMDRVRRGEHDLTDLDPTLRHLVEDTLDPEPANRPSLDELRDWFATIGRDRPHPRADDPSADDRSADDPFTMPLAVAALATATPRQATRVLPEGSTHRFDPDRFDPDRFDTEQPAPMAASSVVGRLEKARRGALVLAGLSVVAGAVALAPYLALVVLSIGVWLLRSGSKAASSAGLRRATRGIRWYDGVQVLLAAPWHAVAAIPGALLLVLWSTGLGLAAALLCFAAGTTMLTGLGIIGAVLGAGLWWGPGSRRVRSPVQRLSHPLSARPVAWFFALLLTVAAASALGAAASSQGPYWTPADNRPFADYRLPALLQP